MTTVVGQDILDLLNDNLGGYQNGVDEATKLRRLNEAKDAVWEILREQDEDYFVTVSQNTTPGEDDYFANLAVDDREYDLPKNLRQVRFIECTTSGYEHLRFESLSIADSRFQDVRKGATADGSSAGSPSAVYYYAIIGKRTMLFAQFPEAVLALKIWYVRALDDIELATEVDEILFPYSKKVAEYAAQRILLSLQDEPQSDAWMVRWKESVQRLSAAASNRTSDLNFVEDFLG